MASYNFPSGTPQPKWKYSADKKCNCTTAVLVTIAIMCTVGYFVMAHIVDAQKAHSDRVIYEFDKAYYLFCDQAKRDHVAKTDEERQTLINLCGEYDQ